MKLWLGILLGHDHKWALVHGLKVIDDMLDLTVLDATVAEIANIGTVNNCSEWLAFSFAVVYSQYGLAHLQFRH